MILQVNDKDTVRNGSFDRVEVNCGFFGYFIIIEQLGETFNGILLLAFNCGGEPKAFGYCGFDKEYVSDNVQLTLWECCIGGGGGLSDSTNCIVSKNIHITVCEC